MELSTRKALFTLGINAFGKIAELIKHTDYLPQKPEYQFKLLKMVTGFESNSNEIAQEMTKDKELVAQVLNIPSLKQNYTSLNEENYIKAISNLEKTLIQSLVEVDIAKKYHRSLMRTSSAKQTDRWRHSIKAAIIAKSVAKWVDYKELELAFMGALLSEVPVMVLSINEPEEARIIEEKVEHGLSEKEAEIVVRGFDHYEFGAKLFKYYSMPADMIDIMQNGLDPSRVKPKNKKLVQIINFSKYISKCFADKSQSPSSIWQGSQKAISDLGLEISSDEWGNKISLLFVKSIEFEMSVMS